MAKKMEEGYGTKVLMNVADAAHVDLSEFSEEKAKETRREGFMRAFRCITGRRLWIYGGLGKSLA